MSGKREFKVITCMDCGQPKPWPDAFPDTLMAECWRCVWNSHIHRAHPKIVRRIKRAAKKRSSQRSRRQVEADLKAAMFDDEFHQAFGTARRKQPTAETAHDEQAAVAPSGGLA